MLPTVRSTTANKVCPRVGGLSKGPELKERIMLAVPEPDIWMELGDRYIRDLES